MAIVFKANADGTHTASLPKSKRPPPQTKPNPSKSPATLFGEWIEEKYPGIYSNITVSPQPTFSLSNLKPFLPDPFTEEASGKTLDEIALEEVWCDMIRSSTLEVLEDHPGGNDELWRLLNELVLDPDADGNPRFTP